MKTISFFILLTNVVMLSAGYDYSTSAQPNTQFQNQNSSTMSPNYSTTPSTTSTFNTPNMIDNPNANQNPNTFRNPNATTFQPRMKTSLNINEDSSVLNNIRDNLTNYQGVSVSVYRGDVTLRGTIASQQEKDRIEREVRRISGVRTVDNQIQVVGNGAFPSRG